MDVSRCYRLATVFVSPSQQGFFAPEVHSSFRLSSWHGVEDSKKTRIPCRRDVSESGDGRMKGDGSAINVARAALNEDGAGAVPDEGVIPLRSSTENNGIANSLQTSPQTKAVRLPDSNSTSKGKGGETAPTTTGGHVNHARLFRVPITGGVQSATSSHGLPHPVIAVRNLIEQARYAHLCTTMSRIHHRRWGYPFGSLVDFATDSYGHPIFSFLPLAIHTRNLVADPRCTLVVQIPGWSGLANARVTIFGDVYPLPAEEQELAHKYYIGKHQQGASHEWGNFTFYRMEDISDIYFVGGFGTVTWVDVKEYNSALPDAIAANGAEQTLKELNTRFSRPLRELLSLEVEVDDAALISIDSKGVDVRVRQGAQCNVQRVSFEECLAVETLDQADRALQKILDRSAVRMPGVN